MFGSRRALALPVLVLTAGLTLGALFAPLAGRVGERAGAATPTTGAGDPATPTVSVNGEGRVTVQFDMAQVVLGVETTSADLAQAQAENAQRTEAVLNQLKALGIAENDLQTVGYTIWPQYERDGAALTGYRVSNNVRTTVRDLNTLGAKIDAAIAAGANRVQGITFDLSNKDDAMRRAREAAFNDARAKAEQYAQLAGRQLGTPVAIVEGGEVVPLPHAMPAAARDVAAPETPIEPGEGAVRVTVQVRYELR